MLRLDTVILRHVQRASTHFDWLLVNPEKSAGPLVAFRLATALSSPAVGRWELTEIAPHRRRYLHYEGPISGGRGSVVRVDQGSFVALLWTPRRRMLDLTLRSGAMRLELIRITDERWIAKRGVAHAADDEADAEAVG